MNLYLPLITLEALPSNSFQQFEGRTVNPCVAGSSPARGAKYSKPHSDVGLFCVRRLLASYLPLGKNKFQQQQEK